mmetsp:Transcript_15611/g.26021  ORF Transcript_15611/g.26021 Transcript_15611/m.26021 type:complete len:154 (-) Transcript_15611:235-696(-)
MAAALRGAFVDEKGVRWDTNDADFEGFLYKKSRWVREWRKRYFILKGSKIFYAKTTSAAPHGMIDLVDCVSVKADVGSKKPSALEVVTRDECISMHAASDQEREGWLGAVGKAIVKHSSMLISEDDCRDSNDSGDDGDSHSDETGSGGGGDQR